MKKTIALTTLLLLGFTAQAQSTDSIAKDKQNFIKEMVEQHGFDKEFVTATLTKASKSEPILNAIARPWEAKPWHQYYPIFITEKRINKGVAFWKKHQTELERASKELGIPPQIIVAIIGVETYFGTYKGKYPVLDALYTLGFYYPKRSKFFKSELKEYFLLAREENFDMTQLKGSYAGAMGWGQFISSSYRHYAIDFDGDNIRDLFNNPSDAIGSVANYFKEHGWKAGEPVAFPASVTGSDYKNLVNDNLKSHEDFKTLKSAGVSTEAEIDDNRSSRLLELEIADGHEYWVTHHNFYVITRYNHSPLYAMAVYQLSEKIKEAL